MRCIDGGLLVVSKEGGSDGLTRPDRSPHSGQRSTTAVFTDDRMEVESLGQRSQVRRPGDDLGGHPMPLPTYRPNKQSMRDVIRRARKITGMLQGTMGLEGQGLDKQTLRRMKRETIGDLLRLAQ